MPTGILFDLFILFIKPISKKDATHLKASLILYKKKHPLTYDF